jgi:membrane-associated phospholipid phosphatase
MTYDQALVSTLVPTARLDHGRTLFGILAFVAAISLAMLVGAGFRPVMPLGFVLLLAILLPAASALSASIRAIEGRANGRRGTTVALAGIGAGLGLLLLYQAKLPVLIAVVVFVLALSRLASGRFDWPPGTWMASASLACGYTAVWNVNYLALWLVRDRIADVQARAVDVAMYEALFRKGIEYRGWFPLVQSHTAFGLFESAYVMLFLELGVMLFVLGSHRQRLTEYLVRAFSCYAVGVLVFLVWPIAGPCLAYPDSISARIGGTITGGTMRSALIEYAAIVNGLQPTTGFGYFVGFPSLHAAMAVVFQHSLRGSRMAFWVFLPINILMAASTFVLGYHYIIDTAAGVALGWLAVRLIHVPGLVNSRT